MWSVLSDNISLKNILDICEEPRSKKYKSNYYVQRYLYALILWEAIYKAPRKSRSKNAYIKADYKRKENELIKKVKNTIYDLPSRYSYDEIEQIAIDVYGEKEWYTPMISKESQEIREDSAFYLTLGEIENMNTLLSEERAEFIEQSGISKRIWSREDLLKYLDREVFEIYKDIYSFMGKDVISIQTPLLIDYICKNATTLQDAIEISFQLKENKDIVQFRQMMNSLDDAINSGNILQIKEYEDALSEIVEQFISKDVKSQKIELKFTVTPSLNNPSISAVLAFPMQYNNKRKINMNFLVNLAQYGLSQGYRRC